MASEMDIGLQPPVRAPPCAYLLNTEAQARAAFYSHEKCIRTRGRFEIIGDSPAPEFTWTPSPTFGRPLKIPMIGGTMSATRTVTTTCLRTEFVMVAYTYVTIVVRNVLREYAEFVEQLRSSSGVSEEDRAVARDFCKRLYEVYLILTDRVKVHVLLHTIGNVAPACAELSIHTVNAYIAYVCGVHTVVTFTFYEIMQKRGESVPFSTRRDRFLFASQQFQRAYSIFTQHVWVEYSADSPEQARFQRYLVGATLFYQLRAIVCAIRHEKTIPHWRPAAVLVLARRADYLISLLCASRAFGFRAGAETLRKYTDAWIDSTLPAVAHDFPYRTKITTVQQYREGNRFASIIFTENMARGVLSLHYKKNGRFFRSEYLLCSVPTNCLFQGQ